MDYWRQPESRRNACFGCTKRYPACQDHCLERKKEIAAEMSIKEKRHAYAKLRGDILEHNRDAHRRIVRGR